jgi:hypothetical protein
MADGMTPSVYLNGRFLTQSLTGVQRFAVEVTTAIDHLAADGEWPTATVLVPRSRRADASGSLSGSYRHLSLKQVGRTQGHLWEQTELAAAARGGLLVNLGNTAPILAGSHQIVVIHDAGVFDTPESYSRRFRAWYRTLQRGLVRGGAHLVTVSKFSRERIAACLGIDPSGITVMYEGADHISRVVPDSTVLQRHGLRPRQFAIVVGSRAAHKNLAALGDAATALQRRGLVVAVAGSRNPNVFGDSPAAGTFERPLEAVFRIPERAWLQPEICRRSGAGSAR